MFSLQDLCRKNLFLPLVPLRKHVVQRLGLYWEGHGSVIRVGVCFVCVHQIWVLPTHMAVQIAASEGNVDIVKLFLLWKGSLQYAIIRALQGRQYVLFQKYYNQIGDCHQILPLFQDPEIYERCHVLYVTCTFQCLFQHAIRDIMLPIFQKYGEDLYGNRGMVQLLYAMACRLQNYVIIKWIRFILHVYILEAIFTIAFVTKDLSLYSLRYMLLLGTMCTVHTNFISIISRHLVYASKKGLFVFVLQSLQYGGQVDTVLFQAVQYNHTKILAHFIHAIPRATVAKLLLHAVESRASRKTFNLLLSSIYYCVYPFVKKLLHAVVQHKYMLIIQLLLERPKKKIYLVHAALFKLVQYSTYTEILQYMDVFSVDPKRVVKMAARLMRVDLFTKISIVAWEDILQRIKHLIQMVYTMYHRNGKNLLLYNIHNITGYTHLYTKEAFILSKFYAVHNATCLFTEMCTSCFVHVTIQFRELLADCLHIAITHAYIQIAETADVCIKYIHLITPMLIMKIYQVNPE
uniref:p505_9R n=1 Tax=African swine fever virus TaxID=10497 RepID=A0A6G7KTY8_ASF